MRRKLGGEFEINPKSLIGISKFEQPSNKFLYSTGRSALYAILKHLTKSNKNVIHVPYYTCVSVINVCKNAGFSIKFYEPEDDFSFPADYLNIIVTGESLLTVNYFGFVDDNKIIKMIKEQRPDIQVISDHVQAFWTFENSLADFSFTSLRKHFAVPEGALLLTKDKSFKHDTTHKKSEFAKTKLIGQQLKYFDLPDVDYLFFLKEAENELDEEDQPRKANSFTHYLFSSVLLDDIKAKRKRNYKLLNDLGRQIGLNFIFPYNDQAIPLSVPILLDSRDEIREMLFKENIFLPVYWPLNRYNRNSKLSKIMAENSLSLVIDQRLSADDIVFQIDKLKEKLH